MDMDQYLDIFIEETKEHLQEMNETLLELEDRPDDLKLLDAIFRVAHSIKGMAGTMGYTSITNLTHKMESLMHEVRSGNIQISSRIINSLFECFDALESYLEHLVEHGVEGDLDTTKLVSELALIISGDDKLSLKEAIVTTQDIEINEMLQNTINKALELGDNISKIQITLDSTVMLKSARTFIIFNTLEEFGEVIASNPTAEDLEAEKFDLSFQLLYISKLDAKAVKAELLNISEVNEVKIESIEDKFELISDIQKKTQPKTNNKKVKAKEKPSKKKASKTVRVDIERLDNLMNLVSELIIIKTRLEDNGKQKRQETSEMHETIEYLERITTSLHDAVMKVRMVPVERTFNRFPRMVRDLSKDLGKGINLVMSGEDTEVDRTVIDEIGDPLIHLIRNSIDHGIEDKATRIARGKDENGTVALRAYSDGNTVVIEVEDDGNGIDSEVIKNIAINKGMLTEEKATSLTEKEAINLLFEAGFSTAKEVTDLSGRGVGLDVVKSKIEELSGTVEVTSNLGKGSKFTIRLPLTLAIIQALMIKLKEEQYAIPLNTIKEITIINKSKVSLLQGQEVTLYRDKTLPLIRLGDKLLVPDYNLAVEDMLVVIIRKGDKELGVIVDSLVGQQEIVIKSLGSYLKGLDIIAGATILGNGGVALIVDSNKLF